MTVLSPDDGKPVKRRVSNVDIQYTAEGSTRTYTLYAPPGKEGEKIVQHLDSNRKLISQPGEQRRDQPEPPGEHTPRDIGNSQR